MRKSVFTAILILAITLCLISYAFAIQTPDTLGSDVRLEDVFSGSGTQDEPYLILSAEGMKKLADAVNGGNDCHNTYFLLMNDMDLCCGNESEWTPIGYSNNHPFSGTFDGGGHEISGLYISETDTDYLGLFGRLKGGTVRKLGVSGDVTGGKNVGGIAGDIDSSSIVKNCYYTGSVSGSTEVGGIVGGNSGNVTGCYNTGTITGEGNVGGVVGYNINGSVLNCYNTGEVSRTGSYSQPYVGGIVGYIWSGTVTSCYSTGIVNGVSKYVGGVAGGNRDRVSNCYFLENTAEKDFGEGRGTEVNCVTSEDLKTLAKILGVDWQAHPILGRPVLTKIPEGNTGTHYDPYIISGLQDLENFRDYVNTGNTGEEEYFRLDDDMDLDVGNVPAWTPVGSSEKQFRGTFDGNGHEIRGLYINRPGSDDQGLFGCVGEDGTVKNLGVSGTVTGGDNAGGLVGIIDKGKVENCYSTSEVNGNRNTGGIAGYNGGEIINCYSTGTVTGGENIGGISGFGGGKVVNCYYLSTCGAEGEGTGSTSGQFASGEVTWRLQNVQNDPVWGQTVGEDEYPVFDMDGNKAVYMVDFSGIDEAIDPVYTNSSGLLTAPAGKPVRKGFTFDGWYADGDFSREWVFEHDTVSGDMTLYARWTAVIYTVNVEETENGTLEASPAEAAMGEPVTLTAIPAQGCQLVDGSLLVTCRDTESLIVPEPVSESTYTFTMPAGNVTVNAEFERIPAKSVELDHSQMYLTEGDTATLTASVIPESAGTVSWNVDNTYVITLSSSTINTVTIKAENAGTAIVTASVDSQTAACTVTVAERGPVAKPDQKLPEDLEFIAAVTLDSITVESPHGEEYEFSIDGINWQSNGVFTGLEPGTEYEIYVRLKETEECNASEPMVKTVTTAVAQKEPSAKQDQQLPEDLDITATVTGNSIIIESPDGEEYEFSIDGVNWQSNGVFTGLEPGTEYTIYVRLKETDDYYASEIMTRKIATSAKSDTGGGEVPDTGGHSGRGGSSSPSTYPPIISETGNGVTSSSPRNPQRGDTVTIIPVPDEGYEVGDVTVKDSRGNKVDVTDNDDGTYGFIQPSVIVTIEVTFVPKKDGEADPPSTAFSDLDPDAWYRESVDYATGHGLMDGYDDGTFGPNNTIFRAAIVQILYKLEVSLDTSSSDEFFDATDTMRYADAVSWASVSGITSGYDSGSFGADDPISREDLAVMLYRFELLHTGGLSGERLPRPDYTNAAEISDHAYEAVAWCTMNGILLGYDDGSLRPQCQATRAEAAAMLMRFLSRQTWQDMGGGMENGIN